MGSGQNDARTILVLSGGPLNGKSHQTHNGFPVPDMMALPFKTESGVECHDYKPDVQAGLAYWQGLNQRATDRAHEMGYGS